LAYFLVTDVAIAQFENNIKKRRLKMPRMDKTGPYGTGPVGRGMGTCCGGGLAYERGGGRMTGRGFRWGGYPGWRSISAVSQEDEKTILEQQKNWLKTQVEIVEKRLENIKDPEG
jgi:hypothetical protein